MYRVYNVLLVVCNDMCTIYDNDSNRIYTTITLYLDRIHRNHHKITVIASHA